MKSRSSLLAMSLLGALMAMTASRCATDDNSTTDAGTHKDGGTKTDGGTPDATTEPDAGEVDAGEPDAGNPDAGPVETNVVAINDLEAEGHPATGSKVIFHAVVVVPPYTLQKPKSTDTTGDCLWGTFVTDATAGSAEHNGLLVTSYGTYDFTAKKCNLDSKLHTDPALAEGDELEVHGLYYEFCGGQSPCADQDQSGKEITFPQIASNQDGDITATGRKPGVPNFLPASVNVSDVYSEGAATPFTLGAQFRTYRGVLVRLSNVEVANTNPDAPNEYCDFTVKAAGTTGPALRVADDLPGLNSYNCDYRPLLVGTPFESLTGILYWSFKSSKLLPRSPQDGTPEINAGQGILTDVTTINNLDDMNHPEPGSRVTFKAIAASSLWEVSHSGCLWGIFMADRSSGLPDYNGVVVYSKGTKDASGNCLPNDVLRMYEQGYGSIRVGEEYLVTGTYTEYGYSTDSFNNKVLSIPEVQVVSSNDFSYQGYPLRKVPYAVPTVTPGDLYSTRTGSGTTWTITALGSSWWKYRCVLVKLQDVKVVSLNPDGAAPGTAPDFCEWGVAAAGATTPMLRVDDAMMFGGTTCPHRPTALDTAFSEINGFAYWANRDAKILPRDSTDATPNLP